MWSYESSFPGRNRYNQRCRSYMGRGQLPKTLRAFLKELGQRYILEHSVFYSCQSILEILQFFKQPVLIDTAYLTLFPHHFCSTWGRRIPSKAPCNHCFYLSPSTESSPTAKHSTTATAPWKPSTSCPEGGPIKGRSIK
jgi:hypothetical protein